MRKSPRRVWREAKCGHLIELGREREEECPYCRESREALEADVLARLADYAQDDSPRVNP